jgi:hypothetical protein
MIPFIMAMVLDPSALKGKLKTGEEKIGRQLWCVPFLGYAAESRLIRNRNTPLTAMHRLMSDTIAAC